MPRSGHAAPDELSLLTKREREVLRLVAGTLLTTKEVAVALNVSPRAVDDHRASIMEKLGARNLAHLIMIYRRLEEGSDAKMVTVSLGRRDDPVLGEPVTLTYKRTPDGLSAIGATAVPGTAQIVPASQVDGQGRYKP